MTVEQRLLSGLPDRPESGCWEWSRARLTAGYGQLNALGQRTAHRVAFLVWNGPIPTGSQVLHSCDNPPCCNPAHLRLGTHGDNMRDKVLRERTERGVRNNRAVLTENDVRAIRASSEGDTALARKYGVWRTTIHNARHRRTWKHIP